MKRLYLIMLALAICVITGCSNEKLNSENSDKAGYVSGDNVVIIDGPDLELADGNYFGELAEGNCVCKSERSGNELMDGDCVCEEKRSCNELAEGTCKCLDGSYDGIYEKQSLLYCVNARDSRQKLDYLVYTPAEYDVTTPIFIFLHGDGDTAMTFSEELERYEFLRKLQNRQWQPDFIFVMPIAKKQGHWAKEVKNVVSILEETVEDVGGSLDNIYISGASAGSNGLTVIAQEMDFKGAIYMAGFVAAEYDSVEPDEWLELWKGKKVYYYRDNLYTHGGYGYRTNEKYLESVQDRLDDYDIEFRMIDLDWNHDIGLVDATLLPFDYKDLNGNVCWDAAEVLIYGE